MPKTENVIAAVGIGCIVFLVAAEAFRLCAPIDRNTSAWMQTAWRPAVMWGLGGAIGLLVWRLVDGRQWNQFSIAQWLYVSAVVALAVSMWQSPTSLAVRLATLVVLEVVVFLFCLNTLTSNLPTALAEAQLANCNRGDGTFSRRRYRIEQDSLRKLRRHIATILLLVAVPTNLMVCYVHFEVIPLTLAVDAVSQFNVSPSAWKSNLRKEEARFDAWSKQKHSLGTVTAHKRLLWRGWPLVAVIAVAWVGGSLVFIRRAYFQALSELSDSVQLRMQQYQLVDFHRSTRRERVREKIG